MAFPEKNHTYGSYKVFFDLFAPNTKVGNGQRYLGNTPELNLAVESDNLDHIDTDNGIRTKDDSMLLELIRSGSLVTDHVSPENLAAFFLGAATLVSQSAAVGETYTIESAKLNRRYQIGATALLPAGVRGIENVVVTVSATPMVLGTDYTVDLDDGGIILLSGGTLAEEDEVLITFDLVATSYNRVVSAADAQVYGGLFFKSNNPKGEKMDYFFPYVQLRPDGDFPLKSEDWQVLPFSFDVLKLNDATPSVFINGRPGSGV